MVSLNPVENFYRIIKNKPTVPRWAIFSLDLFFCAFAFFYAYLLRFNMDYNLVAEQGLAVPLVVITALNLLFFRSLRTYEGIIRLSGAQEGARVVIGVFCSVMVLLMVNAISVVFSLPFLIPTSVLFIYFFTSSFILFAYRLIIRNLYHNSLKGKLKQEPVFVFGKAENGLVLKSAIESIGRRKYQVVGIINDNPKLWGKSLDKARIFGFEQMEQAIQKHGIKDVFLSSDTEDLELKNKIADFCLNRNISVKVVPAIRQWVDGQLHTKQIKDLKIEDLLNRPSIELAPDHINSFLAGKRVLVTGAAGSIGSEIVKQVSGIDVELLILCDNRETGLYDLDYELKQNGSTENVIVHISDIRNADVMRNLFHTYKPQVVFHAAAYKHVPLMEQHPCQAVRNNVLGTKVIADLSVEFGVERFVFISTDKAINPTNVMGASKRIAEMYVAELQITQQQIQRSSLGNFDVNREVSLGSRRGNTKFITTRFGNVLGSNGSVIPRFQQQIEKGGPVTVTDPGITRYFMTIPEACSLVLEAATMGQGGEIFVFDMGEPVKIADLAFKMIKLAGMIPGKDIEVVYSGLRPGEKLYEELLNKSEAVMATHHKKIMISKVAQTRPPYFLNDVEELIKIAETSKNMHTVKKMKSMVSEFKSKNSVYEKLDIEQREANISGQFANFN